MENEEMVDEDYLTWMLAAGDRDDSITLDDMLDEFVAVLISGICIVCRQLLLFSLLFLSSGLPMK